MQLSKKVLLGFIVILICFCVTNVWSSQPSDELPSPYIINLEPMTSLGIGYPVSFKLTYELKSDYEQEAGELIDFHIWIAPNESHFTKIESVNLTEQLNRSSVNSVGFELTIPDNNVYVILIEATSENTLMVDNYFIGSQNSSTIITKNPRELTIPEEETEKVIITTDVKYEKLTDEQKQLVFKYVVDLRDSKNREFVENLVGPLPESSLINRTRHGYTIETTIENIYKILTHGIEAEDAGERPRWKYDTEKDTYELIPDTSTGEVKEEETQGQIQKILRDKSSPDIYEIYIDSVSPQEFAETIPTGELVTFYLHVQSSSQGLSLGLPVTR